MLSLQMYLEHIRSVENFVTVWTLEVKFAFTCFLVSCQVSCVTERLVTFSTDVTFWAQITPLPALVKSKGSRDEAAEIDTKTIVFSN